MQTSLDGHSLPTEILPLFQDPAHCHFSMEPPLLSVVKATSPLTGLLLHFLLFLEDKSCLLHVMTVICPPLSRGMGVLRPLGTESPGVGKSLC